MAVCLLCRSLGWELPHLRDGQGGTAGLGNLTTPGELALFKNCVLLCPYLLPVWGGDGRRDPTHEAGRPGRRGDGPCLMPCRGLARYRLLGG